MLWFGEKYLHNIFREGLGYNLFDLLSCLWNLLSFRFIWICTIFFSCRWSQGWSWNHPSLWSMSLWDRWNTDNYPEIAEIYFFKAHIYHFNSWTFLSCHLYAGSKPFIWLSNTFNISFFVLFYYRRWWMPSGTMPRSSVHEILSFRAAPLYFSINIFSSFYLNIFNLLTKI